MTLEEFKRPYTDAELLAKFENAGFDESIWNFCQDIYYNYQTYLENDFGWLRDGETIEQLIINLKEDEGWESESTREEAWRQAMSKEHIEVYLDQRAKGHGHHWSWIAALELDWNGNISWDEVLRHLKTIDESLAKKEVEIFLNRLSEGKPEAYRKFLEELISPKGYSKQLDEVEACAKPFLVVYECLYERFIKLGRDRDEIYNYARDLTEDPDRATLYIAAYNDAICNVASSNVARSFADKIEELKVNGTLLLDSRAFCEKFKETWQREFYYDIIMERVYLRDEDWSVVDKNRLRTSLGLPPLDEPLTVEDTEYLRIRQDLMANGMNEISDDRKAYKAVYEQDAASSKPQPISEAERIKQDTDHMLFSNKEDYLDGEC